ncbi:AAA family ATPase [Vibrio alginolyticus]
MKLTNHINKVALEDGKRRPSTWDLKSLKQINFFIGPNNSGKSRKLRTFFEIQKAYLIFDSDLMLLEDYIACMQDIDNHKKGLLERHCYRNIDVFIKIIRDIIDNDKAIGLLKIRHHVSKRVFGEHPSQHEIDMVDKYLWNPLFRENESKFNLIEKISQLQHWESRYIPTLRSLRNIDKTDLLHQRTSADYFRNSTTQGAIFTGHTLYEDVKAHLLGTYVQREKVRNYERYLSENFFFGQDISLVPRIDANVIFFKEGEKEERPIYDLGDGIQSIIMLTYPIFMANKNTMFFIEEPELFLHAGLQRTLIETYANHEEHMFFITTHSNHFLDIAQERDDISIQKVCQNDDGNTEVTPAEEFGELLTELGVRASSVLLANCSIWVEGITDKLYLRTYLNKYIQELRENGDDETASQLSSYHENLHFVFTEYQGSNITHWYFGDSNSQDSSNATPAKKLNHKILLIADADIDGKGDRVEQLEQDLGDALILLKWKEIENYIPQEIIIKTAEARWDTFYGKKDCTFNSANITKPNLFEKANEGIGRILERYVKKPSNIDRNFYSDTSGTIKDKVKFCHKAIEIMNSEDTDWQLTPDLTKLCERIWGHVIDSNK